MALRAKLPARRPVFIASYEGTTPVRAIEPRPTVPDATPSPEGIALRYAFPAAGVETLGGHSDGYCFTVTFAAGKLERTYAMVREFLVEQGYGSVPVPADTAELKAFRLPPKLRHQLSLFEEDGYSHNPLKILFPPKGGKRGSLTLCLYNERADNHLLRFHQRNK